MYDKDRIVQLNKDNFNLFTASTESKCVPFNVFFLLIFGTAKSRTERGLANIGEVGRFFISPEYDFRS